MFDRVDDAPTMAVFCDFENVAIGVREARYDEFDIHLVLERLLHKGKIVVKKAYADWDRYKSAKRQMHEAGFEMIEIPHVSYSGKNSADIRLVVDALDLCYVKRHVDVFVIVSGDSDFSPLVSKLRENNKVVIGLGVKSSTSDLLIENCDEFIYYDDLVRERSTRRTDSGTVKSPRRNGRNPDRADRPDRPKRPLNGREELPDSAPHTKELDESGATPLDSTTTSGSHPLPPAADAKTIEARRSEALDLVLDVVETLFKDRDGNLHGALVKQTLKRRRPNFSERFHGYRTFNQLLEEAVTKGLLEAAFDDKHGGYVISAFGPNA